MPKGVWTSPIVYSGVDEEDRRASVSFTFNTSTLAFVEPGLTGTRDVGCIWDRMIFSTNNLEIQRVVLIPEGEFSAPVDWINGLGFTTMKQITDAGFVLGNEETPTDTLP